MENTAISPFEKKAVLFSCLTGAFLTPFVLSSVNIALPAIEKELFLNVKQMADISTYFLISSFSFLFPAAVLSDYYGRIRVMKYGFLFFSFFSILAAYSSSPQFLIFSRAGQGAASAFIFANVMAVIASVFDRRSRGKAIGLVSASVYLGLTAGPFLGGFFLKYFSWRFIFKIAAFMAAFSYLFSLIILKTDFKAGKNFNRIKLLIFTLLILIFSFSFSYPDKATPLIPVSLLGLFIFFRADFKRDDIFKFRELFSSRKFIFACAAAFFHYAGSFSLTFIFSLYLQYYLLLPAQKAGLVLFFMPFAMSVFSPPAGKLSDRFDAGKIASIGILISLTGILAAALAGRPGVYLCAVLLAVIGTGFAFFSSPNSNSAMSALNFSQYSSGSALLSAVRLFGQNVSMAFCGYLMSLLIDSGIISSDLPAFLKSFRIILFCGVFFLLTAAYFSLGRTINERKDGTGSIPL